MARINVKVDILERFCTEAFRRFGFTEEDSKIITDVLLTSDRYGIESHGMNRMARYHMGIRKGFIDLNAKNEIVFETPVSAVIDGHAGMGHLVAYHAMQVAIEKAKKSGIAIVSVRNSNHYGIAGYYAKMACNEGLIGMAFTNSEAIMVPTFSSKAMIGSNPIAVCVPADPYPFFFDAATTVVTRGKVEMYKKAEKPLPDGWALEQHGLQSNDANEVLSSITNKLGGGIMPLGGNVEQTGGHKGYGHGVVSEMFSSIFSMGTTSNHISTGSFGGTCHGFMAINPAIFGDAAAIKEYFSSFLQELRDTPPAAGCERVYTHGQKAAAALERTAKEGVPVDVKTLLELKHMGDDLGMDFASYFGDMDLEDPTYKSEY